MNGLLDDCNNGSFYREGAKTLRKHTSALGGLRANLRMQISVAIYQIISVSLQCDSPPRRSFVTSFLAMTYFSIFTRNEKKLATLKALAPLR